MSEPGRDPSVIADDDELASTARRVRERFLELRPRRHELSLELFGSTHGMSMQRLFVLLALCEAEIPSMSAVRAMARTLPIDSPVRRMRHYGRLNELLMRLVKRGLINRAKREGAIWYEPVDKVCRALADSSGPASSNDDAEGNTNDTNEPQTDDAVDGSGCGNEDC